MVTEIPLTQGYVALVDDADFDAVSQFKWYAQREKRKNHPDQFSAVRKVRVDGRQKLVYMHRFITGCPSNVDPDHIDGDSLNNQRSNLRNATNSMNQANRIRLLPSKSSAYRGVTLHRQTGRWQAAIKVHNKGIYLGLFSTEESAAIAYDAAAETNFGEFARLNFPDRRAA